MSKNITRYHSVYGSALGWKISQIAWQHPKIICFCSSKKNLETLKDDLSFFTKGVPILTLTGWETLPFEEVSPLTDISSNRIKTLLAIKKLENYIILVAPEALFQKTLSEEIFNSLSFSLELNQIISRENLQSSLTNTHFHRVETVSQVGQYALRGNVIDIYSSDFCWPARVYFDDDLINQIVLFDPENQRSFNHSLSSLKIYPVKETVIYVDPSPYYHCLPKAIESLKTRGKFLQTPPREIARFMTALKAGMYLPGYELINFICQENTKSLFDFLDTTLTFIVEDEVSLNQFLENYEIQIESRYQRLASDNHLIPEKSKVFLNTSEIIKNLSTLTNYYVDSFSTLDKTYSKNQIVNLKTRNIAEISYKLNFKRSLGTSSLYENFIKKIISYLDKDYCFCFVVGSMARAKKLESILLENNLEATISEDFVIDWINRDNRKRIIILTGSIAQGFIADYEKLIFISENQLFPEKSSKKLKSNGINFKKIIQSLSKLKPQDLVVHQDYGIGLYKGLKHFTVEDGEGDFLHIEYADSTLYVPVQNISRVQKFVASEGQRPSLDKLSSTKWQKTKENVRTSVISLAGDLIRLYASREVNKGWRFEPYGFEDEMFAESFPYTETADQTKAIEETIEDMAKDKVMDRLICGDVGFGKTEVAIRAAFKCARHRRQVAVLVPTTILAEQHLINFRNRLQEFDIEVESLSRFNSAKKNKEIIESLKLGKIDIIIGTHRLLSKDVIFKDLGLLIIDEEHRFGVQQKEKLKALKKSIDVLTLTATPIPRTLHMSLLGIRDISVIQTPPVDRRTIKTYIANYDPYLVRDAILREIQRQGQVFYLHNKVQSIDLTCQQLKHIVPEASFGFAHGQMSEHQLENIMHDFINKKFDVLVSTTIIESGIDIPNANTLIVERADIFGLAQLYQLRGRVGRSTRQAYAYLLVPKIKNLNQEARQRLSALQSLDELGMGFNLAMQDLEIRGAGNLLGKEQSGNVASVGFDLYTKILKEAILHVKGEELDLSEVIDPEIKLPINAYIPEFFIPDVSERLILYQRLAGIESEKEAYDLLEEIKDRFGNPPLETYSLYHLMRLRALLRSFGVLKAELQKNILVIHLSQKAKFDIEKIYDLCNKFQEKFKLGKNLTLSIKLDDPTMYQPDDLYPIVETFLKMIKG